LSTLKLLAPPAGAKPEDDCLRGLLALEVVKGALRTPDRTADQAVELFQVSAATPNGLRTAPPPEQKLTAAQIVPFGAFYQGSWRYSDWMWGRLDGAHRVVQLLLEPARFAQAVHAAHADAPLADRPRLGCEMLHALAVTNEADPERRQCLEEFWANEAD